MNDILIKLAQAANLISYLEERFATVQRYIMKLNPKKYVF